MSRVKKLQNGGTSSTPVTKTNSIRFKVNKKDYDLDQEALDTEFQDALNKEIQSGSISKDEADKYSSAYTKWKDQATKGTYSIDRRGDSFGDMKFEGQGENVLGLDEEGNTAKPSFFRRRILGQSVNPSDENQVMSRINSIMGNAIAKQSSIYDKKISDEEASKKLEQDNSRKKLITEYSETPFDIHNVLYGNRKDLTREKTLSYNWGSLSDEERTEQLNDYFSKVGQKLFDKNFDDKEISDAMLKRGVDIQSLRNIYNSKGWSQGSFKGFTPEERKRVMRSLGTNITDDDWINKPKVQEPAKGAGTSTEAGGAAVQTQGQVQNQQQVNDKGIATRNVDVTRSPFYTIRDSSGNRTFMLNKKPVSSEELYKFLSGRSDDQFSRTIRNVLNESLESENKLYGFDKTTGQYKNYYNINEQTIPLSARNSAFVFDKGFKGIASNITSIFSKVGKGDNLHVIEYAQPDRFGFRQSKYMVVTPTGKKTGSIHVNGAGESIFKSDDGHEFNLGKRLVSKTGNVRTDDFAPFSSVAATRGPIERIEFPTMTLKKEGGKIKKLQIGGISKAMNSEPKQKLKQHSATMSEAFNPNVSMSTADKAALTGLAFDTAGLIASMTGVGSLAGAGLGLAGSTSTLVSDISRDGLDWGDVGNFAASAGMDVLTAVPGLGIGTSAGKIAKSVRASQKVLMPLLMGAGLKGAADVVGKITRGEDVTISDWRNLASGLHGLVGGANMAKNVIGTKKATSSFIEASIGGKKTKFKLDESDLAEINKGKTDVDKMELAKLKISEKYNIENPDDIKLNQKITGLKFGLNPLKKSEQFKIGTEKGELQLKDINQYKGPGIKNAFMRNAIKSAAAQNPNAEGAREIVGDNFNLLGFLGHRARMNPNNEDYNAAKSVVVGMNKMNLPKGHFLNMYDKPAGPATPLINNKPQLALAEGSGRKYNQDDDELLRVFDKAKQRKLEEEELGETIGNERLIRSSARISSVPVRVGDKNLNRISYNKNREAAERNVETKNANKAIQEREANKIAKEKETKARYDKEIVNRENRKNSRKLSLNSNILSQTKKQGKVFVSKSNGKNVTLSKSQINTLNKIKPENRQKFIDNNFKKGGVLKASFGRKGLIGPETESDMFDPKFDTKLNPIPIDKVYFSKGMYEPRFDTKLSPVSINRVSPSKGNNNPLTFNNTAVKKGVYDVGVNSGGSESVFRKPLNFIKKTAKNIDAVDLSELARATATSMLNRGIDTRVSRPVLQHIEETPISIKGNPLAVAEANRSGNEIVNLTKNTLGSDQTLNRMTMLDAYNRSAKVKNQGALQNADAISKQEAMSTEMQMRNAANRNEIANRNIQSAAEAENVEREGRNIKTQQTFQPYSNFWENTNKRAMYNNYVNKSTLAQIRFNELSEPLNREMAKDTARYDQLYTEMAQNPEVFNKDSVKAKELQDLSTKLYAHQSKMRTLGLRLGMDPNYTPSESVSVRQRGGIIEKINLDMSKSREKTTSEFAKKLVNLNEKKNKEESKQLSINIKHINDLEKLIFRKK